MKMKLIPTKEQQLIIDTAKKGENIIVKAFAGTSKTTSCVMIAEEVQKRSLYVAFNKSIAEEAKTKFPSHVECRTMHSLAYGAIVNGKMRKKLQGWFSTKDVIDLIELNIDKEEELDIACKVTEEIKLFCQSADTNLAKFIKNREVLSELEARLTINYWNNLKDENNVAKITHDVYLKLFQLSQPVLGFEVIYLDEAQDSNPVILDIVLSQANYGSQLIMVGDNFQCLIEGTSVDGKNIETYKEGDYVYSFCKGVSLKQKILKIYKKKIEEKVIKITTETGRTLTSTLDHTHIIKELPIQHEYINYLMYKKEFGYRIGTTQQFRQRCSGETADKVWILNTSDNKQKAYIYEQVTSLKYGIPTLVFKVRNKKELFTQEYYDTIFSSLDTKKAATQLLKDKYLLEGIPHYVPQGVQQNNLIFTIGIMRDVRNINSPYHSYSIFFSKEQVQLLEKNFILYNYRKSKNGSLRLEGITSNLNKIYSMVAELKTVFPSIYIKELIKILDDRSLIQLPARNIVKGMSIVNENGKYEKVIDTKIIDYSGYVYDFDIEHTHNFIANGIVTHNCIYAWRGAVNALENLPESSFKTLYLTESFRFTQEIADKAMKITEYLGNKTLIKGRGKEKPIENRAILVRNNSTLLDNLLYAYEQGEKVYVLADLKGLWSKLYHIQSLWFGEEPRYPDKELKQYKTYKELLKASESLYEIAKLIKLTASLADGQGLHTNINNIKGVIVKKECDADFTLATGHKSKGLEWDEVTLTEDFLQVAKDTTAEETLKEDQTGELIYVALTRAKVKVNLPLEIEELL